MKSDTEKEGHIGARHDRTIGDQKREVWKGGNKEKDQQRKEEDQRIGHLQTRTIQQRIREGRRPNGKKGTAKKESQILEFRNIELEFEILETWNLK